MQGGLHVAFPFAAAQLQRAIDCHQVHVQLLSLNIRDGIVYAGPPSNANVKCSLYEVLLSLLSSQQLGVAPLLDQDEPLQRSLVRLLAAEALAWPPPPQSAPHLDAAALEEQAAVVQLLGTNALQPGFQQFSAER